MEKLEKGMPVPLVVKYQGAMVANSATVVAFGGDVLAVEVDMKSKYGFVGGITGGLGGIPGIIVCANKSSINIQGDRGEPTGLGFPTLKGWDVFCAGFAGRYSIQVCFIKRD